MLAYGYVYVNGQLKAEYENATTYFVHGDHRMSTRLLTGYPTASIVECDDYYPFGELISCGSTTTNTHKFTGKERDSESNLDNFGARYNSSSMGRFMTPDWAARPTAVPYATLGNPQSLNLYSYVEDDPVTRADLDGHCGQVTVAGAPPQECDNSYTTTAKPGEGHPLPQKTGTGQDQSASQQAAQAANNEAQQKNQTQEQNDQQTYHQELEQRNQDFRNKQAAPPMGSPEYVGQVSGKVTAEMNAGNKVIATVAGVEAVGVAMVAVTSATGEAAIATAQRAAAHPSGKQVIDFAQGFAAAEAHVPGPDPYPRTAAGIAGYVVGKLLPF